ncbi:MAG: isochorismatase family cysteine hydrolase [Stappiaceae bacterium]
MSALVLVLPVVAVLAWLLNGIRLIGKISNGPQIGSRANRALVLVDLQTVFWDGGAYDAVSKSAVETAVLSEAASARAKGEPVIAVRQEWSIPSTKLLARLMMKSQAIAGTPGTELAPPFSDLADHRIVKRVQDTFETGEFDQLLKTLDVGTLRIVGLDGNYCVAKTAQAARLRGYEVELVKGAVLSADETASRKTLKLLAEKGVHFI